MSLQPLLYDTTDRTLNLPHLNANGLKITDEMSKKIVKDYLTVSRAFILERNLMRDQLPKLEENNWNPQRTFDLALPFESVWFETSEQLAGNFFMHDCAAGVIILKAFNVMEDEDGEYFFTLLCGVAGERQAKLMHMYVTRENFNETNTLSCSLHALVFHILHFILPKSEKGTIPLKKRMRLSSINNRVLIIVHNVVVISASKNSANRIESNFGLSIDWTNHWEVRGHWRKVEGIGKDSKGKYGVDGLTWVVPHLKGDLEKPFLKQIRIVKKVGPLKSV